MKTVFVDANVILRFLLRDIPLQYDTSRDLFNEAQKGQIIVKTAEIIIFEVSFTLEKYYQFPRQKIIEALKSFLEASYIEVPSKEIFLMALRMYADNTGVSLPDCFLLCSSQAQGAELFTFDEHLKKKIPSS